jgi:hypothetical protein
MKKLLIILAVFFTLGLVAEAQPKNFLRVGVGTSNSVTYESVEFGTIAKKNRISVVLETYNDANNFTFKEDREFYGGIKYTRALPVGKNLDFLISGTGWVNFDSDMDMIIEPGLGAALNVSKNIEVVASISSPIYQNTQPLKPMYLKSGLGLQIRL